MRYSEMDENALQQRVSTAVARLESCNLCARHCGVNRLAGETGVCRIGRSLKVSSAFAHHGEEDIIRGYGGSGTIFVAGCSLHCAFCQNFSVSHKEEGRECSPETLARILEDLAGQGCHNFNFVTPTHCMPQILEGLSLYLSQPDAKALPLVWNTGCYDTVESLHLLDGIVDVYMPDFKFMSMEASQRYLEATDYPEIAMAAIAEMVRQVGPVRLGADGTIERGVLVRHLVIPGMLEDTEQILNHLMAEYGTSIAVNVMGQYRPCGRSGLFAEIDRPLDYGEWLKARRMAVDAGLRLA